MEKLEKSNGQINYQDSAKEFVYDAHFVCCYITVSASAVIRIIV